ncbi:hypothetical protein BWI75_13360 [Gloeocapsopsis sp. AAB1 = 1H9]|uniref:Methyltransferase domain-containing protein n=2 Tax=Gloeocapsopsis TaxID=693222 RepID=A0A6N8FWQ6_9CHRO|nr:class I SAM-dependent methyltransferase [Gloeocapsopsis dulcis]MUL37299.1 hypothetical protein [Gloeocapsopsis dulcis AAB1 = 1H9]
MNISLQEVKTYYDEHTSDKLKNFVAGNARVRKAWLTVEQWAPKNPQRILEIGCGIGDTCWRMTRQWLDAEVVGLDISSISLETAQKLFSSSRLSFVQGPLVKGLIASKFDLIVLMDVYEHIQVEDRPQLHQALKDLINDKGRIILSFPTPRHQAWLRKYKPDGLQPIDEDIDVNTILSLASDLDTEVLLYQEVDVWHEGDYAHAVLGKREDRVVANKTDQFKQGFQKLIHTLLFKVAYSTKLASIRRKIKFAKYSR